LKDERERGKKVRTYRERLTGLQTSLGGALGIDHKLIKIGDPVLSRRRLATGF